MGAFFVRFVVLTSKHVYSVIWDHSIGCEFLVLRLGVEFHLLMMDTIRGSGVDYVVLESPDYIVSYSSPVHIMASSSFSF